MSFQLPWQLRAEFALCTFSLGVLQHDDVVFDPPLTHLGLYSSHNQFGYPLQHLLPKLTVLLFSRSQVP